MTRKIINDETKVKIALEAILEIKTIPELAEEHGVKPATIKKYQKQFLSVAKSPPTDKIKINYPIQESDRMVGVLNEIKDKIEDRASRIKPFKFRWTSAQSEFYVFFATAILAIVTFFLVVFNFKMASYTKELADVYKNPRLDLYLLIESDFDCKPKNYIEFLVNDFRKHKETMRFHFVVQNKWESNIKDDIDFLYKISLFKEDPDRRANKHRTETFNISLGPDMVSQIEIIDEIKERLSEKISQKGINVTDDYKLRIEIKETDVRVTHYPYAGINVKYYNFTEFQDKIYGRLLDGNQIN